jgi:hypothetical protein
MAPYFQLFRFTRLRVTLFPNINTVDVIFAYAAGSLESAGPTTFNQASQLSCVGIQGLFQTTPTVIDIPRKALLDNSLVKWFRTVVNTDPSFAFTQGNLSILTSVSTSGVLCYMLDGECEFSAPTVSGVSMLMGIPMRSPLLVEELKPSTVEKAVPSTDDHKSGTDDALDDVSEPEVIEPSNVLEQYMLARERVRVLSTNLKGLPDSRVLKRTLSSLLQPSSSSSSTSVEPAHAK